MTACAPACSRGVGWHVCRGREPLLSLSQYGSPCRCLTPSARVSKPPSSQRCSWVIRAAVCTRHLSPAPWPRLRPRAPGGTGRGPASPQPRSTSPPPRRVTSGSSGRRLAMTDLVQSRGDPSQSTSFAYICQTFCHFFKKRNTMHMNFKLLYV